MSRSVKKVEFFKNSLFIEGINYLLSKNCLNALFSRDHMYAPETGGWNNVAEGHDPVEQHADHLDQHHQGEEEHEDKAEGLQLQVLVL